MKKVRLAWIDLDKSLRKAFILAMSLVLITVLYKPVWAQINRIVGSNVEAGDGLKLSADNPDTIHVNVGWPMYIDNDTLKPDIGTIWADSMMAMAYVWLESTTAVIDSAVGAERSATALFADSADLITHDHVYNWHIVNQTIIKDDIDTTSGFVFGSAYYKTSAEADSQFMTKGYIDAVAGGLVDQSVKGDHVDSTSEDFVFNDAFHVTSTEADSEYITHGAVATHYASKSEIGDSLATRYIDRFVQPIHAIDRNVSQGFRMLYPIAIGNYNWLAQITSETNDLVDTVLVFSFILPMGCDGDGLDSISFDAYATGAGVADAGIEVMVYKQDYDGATKTPIDSLAQFNTAGAWEHEVISGFTTNASAGNIIRVEMIVNCDATDDTVYFNMIRGAYTGI